MGSTKNNYLKNDSNFFMLLNASILFICLFAIVSSIPSSRSRTNPALTNDQTLGISVEKALAEDYIYPKYIGTDDISFSAGSVLAIDLKSGAILYEKNSREPVLPASTSKIITALVAMDHFDQNDQLFVPPLTVEGQKIGLIEGEMLFAEDLLYALLVSSANDAAEVIAANYPGGRDLFVAAMNMKAQQLGLKNSLFLNPTGLDQEYQATTAHDLVKVSFYAMQNPLFEKIVATKTYNIVNSEGEVRYKLHNINQLLGNIEGVKGIKTGKTDGAMENLLTCIERDGNQIIIAVLGSNDRFGETKNLINWIYKSFIWQG